MTFRKMMTVIATTLALVAVQAAPADAQDIGDTARVFYQAMSENRPELLDTVLAPDWDDIPLAPGQQPGRDGFKEMVAGFHQVFSDLQLINDDVIVAGDKVVVRSTVSGTQVGDFAGFPSKGRPFTVMAIDIHQFADGKIVRTWHIEDWLSGLFQMGAFEPAQ